MTSEQMIRMLAAARKGRSLQPPQPQQQPPEPPQPEEPPQFEMPTEPEPMGDYAEERFPAAMLNQKVNVMKDPFTDEYYYPRVARQTRRR